MLTGPHAHSSLWPQVPSLPACRDLVQGTLHTLGSQPASLFLTYLSISFTVYTEKTHPDRPHLASTESPKEREGASLVTQMVKICQQCRRRGFDLWVGKVPWRREWLPTPVFLPGEFHGQRSLAVFLRGRKELDTTEQLALCSSTAVKGIVRHLAVKL